MSACILERRRDWDACGLPGGGELSRVGTDRRCAGGWAQHAVILRSGFLLLVALFVLSGCRRAEAARRAENCHYMQETLGPLVLEYAARYHAMPETFDEALQESGVTLAHRGDAFGGSLVYRKTGDTAFYFLAYGPDGVDDAGAGDDLQVVYEAGWLMDCAALP